TAFFPGGAYHKSWNFGTVLTRLYLRQQIHKLIVVAVCPVNRDYEYTHAPVWERQWGGLEDYSSYLAQTVKAFVDANYRTVPEPANTAIAGASHGGLAAFYSAGKHPDCFGQVIAMSPSFWVGLDSGMELSLPNYSGPFYGELQSSSLLFETEEVLRSRRLKIYLDWGLVREGGFHNEFIEERATARGREMRDLLIQKFGYREQEDLFVVEDRYGQHTEESWAERMEQALPLFFGAR
ncbi:MAG TPA: alpha/beta hydrolase-fold protein, partial [Chroococcidiopsis sp.]